MNSALVVLLLFTCSDSVSSQAAAPTPNRPTHNYKRTDLGPSPFVDEVTGQCTLSACDALGRARDELYSILHEKDKVHVQSRTLIGELQQAVANGKVAQDAFKQAIQVMEQRVRSLEHVDTRLESGALEQVLRRTMYVYYRDKDCFLLAIGFDIKNLAVVCEFIDMGANKLGTLNKDAFKGMMLLNELDLFDNQIEYLPDAVFDSLENLINLKVHKNKLKVVDEKLFIANINLETLDLSNNGLSELPPGIFRTLRRLTALHLSSNQIRSLDPDLFHGLHQLEDVDVSRNNLNELPPQLFDGLTKLKSIKLNDNSIKVLPSTIFKELSNVEVLQLQNNEIADLPEKVFYDLESLTQLILTGNSIVRVTPGVFSRLGRVNELHLGGNLLEQLSAGCFQGLDNLEKLFLLSNNLRDIDPEAFTGVPKLIWLALNNNLLTTLPADVFQHVPRLTRVQLDSNQFKFLPEGTLEPLKNLQYVNLIKNPWHCDCAILYLTRWINEHPELIWDYQPKCRGPGELGGRSVYTMTFNDVCDGQWASMM